MNFKIRCPKCLHEKKGDKIITIPYENKNNFLLCCDYGHQVKVFYYGAIYPLAFHEGLLAYENKNYFEAFALTFFAYESFMREFVLDYYTYTLQRNDKNFFPNETQFNNIIEPIIKDSNSIKGAYGVVYLSLFGKTASFFPNNLHAIRNKIFHGKKVPTKKDTSKLIETFWQIAKPTIFNLTENTDILPYHHYNVIMKNWIESNGETLENVPGPRALDLGYFVTSQTHISLELGYGSMNPADWPTSSEDLAGEATQIERLLFNANLFN